MQFPTSSRNAIMRLTRVPCCCRSFTTSPVAYSGHNKWSKIKHDKGAADRKKSAQRSVFTKNLTLYSKLYGPDPNMNPQLATVIQAARKAGVPKSNIDSAVERGQGRSSTGEKLENAMLEVMMPPSISMIVSIETDNKNRALMNLKLAVKKHNGIVTPTTFNFTKRGRTILKSPGEGDEQFDDILMQAIDAGVEDIEQDEEAEILESDILWTPSSDKVRLGDQQAAQALGDFLTAVREEPDVQAVYANVERGDVSEETWRAIEENLDL